MIKTISIALFFCLASFFSNAQTLTIKIEGIHKVPGKILLAFFTSPDDFKAEDPAYSKTIKMSEVKNGRVIVSYDDIEQGTYAIALLHDENNDGVMKYSCFVPAEGFGFSDYYQTGIHKPKFQDFSFGFGPEDKTVKIKVKYF